MNKLTRKEIDRIIYIMEQAWKQHENDYDASIIHKLKRVPFDELDDDYSKYESKEIEEGRKMINDFFDVAFGGK